VNDVDPISAAPHLRLVWQWQGAGTGSIRSLASEFPFDVARRGYSVGADHDFGRRVLGEPGAVSHLISKYGDDLAILWIDSHPEMGTGETSYPGFHAMVVSAVTGHGDPEVIDVLPATTTTDRVALVGMHDWTDPMLPAIADEWRLTVFAPEVLRSTSAPLLEWLDRTGATKVAVHFNVDTIDANEIRLGLGADLGGLTSAQACRVVAEIDDATEVVALTIAEFVPRQVMHVQQILAGFPLLG
jgi:arginase